MVTLRLMTTSGEFRTHSEMEVETTIEALEIVKKHASDVKATGLRVVESPDGDGLRYTANVPGFRNGRNIAFLDF